MSESRCIAELPIIILCGFYRVFTREASTCLQGCDRTRQTAKQQAVVKHGKWV